MNIEQYKQKLELCFTEYEEIQTLHLKVMREEPMPDIALMTEERDKVFARLKKNIDGSIANAGSNGGKETVSVLAGFEARLASIMDVSEELSRAIQGYQDNLKTNLAKMQIGKAAMHGYKAVNIN